MANCERCRDPNKVDAQEYTITKTQFGFGEPVKQKRTLCDDCADIERGVGHKLSGGKQEAKPEASTETKKAEPKEEPARKRIEGGGASR